MDMVNCELHQPHDPGVDDRFRGSYLIDAGLKWLGVSRCSTLVCASLVDIAAVAVAGMDSRWFRRRKRARTTVG